MILKGNQRAGAADLASHLMNSLDNNVVEIADLQGTVSDDLHGAFSEFQAAAKGTKAEKFLYSLSINPAEPISREQYSEAITAIEDKLGLAGQPRAIVFHIKEGREHCHVVWSRTNTENMKAIHMSHDHAKLCDLSCELAHKFGHELPPGLKAWEEKNRAQKDKLEATMAENAQAKETGVTPEQRQQEITSAYTQTDTATAFQNALFEKGYILAQGQRRAFVVVDRFGKVHSLTRYIKGHKAKDIKSKLSSVDLAELPTVDEAQEQMANRQKAADEKLADDGQSIRKKAFQILKVKHDKRRLPLTLKEQDIRTRQASERMALHAAQKQESQKLMFRMKSAVMNLIKVTPGLRSVLLPVTSSPNLNPAQCHKLQSEALKERHAREDKSLSREKNALSSVELRELKSLERSLKRQMNKTESESRSLEESTSQNQDLLELEKAIQDKESEEDLTVSFNDAAEFVEGDDPFDEDESQSADWKTNKEETPHGHKKKTGKGYKFRRDSD